jgi:cleavage and polyadenylation specificity factor subunit 3
VTESSKQHRHNHHHGQRNPHANVTPEERFSRICMFLEAQFGPLVTPIEHPKLPQKPVKPTMDTDGIKNEPDDDEEDYEPEEDPADVEAAEIERLHSIGIPVPGVEIKVDKNVAKVWLETLEVECTSAILRERVRAVVERAIETVAPLWGRARN